MKPYFNDHQGLYPGSEPALYQADTISGIVDLEEGFQAIRDELLRNLSNEEAAMLCFKKLTLKKQSGWKQIELMIYGVEYGKRTSLFPETMTILKGIEGVSTAYFSVLSPRARIKAHTGDTDAYYRVHLGLCIPDALPDCGIAVAGQKQSWQEGKCLAFNDIYCHSAWNDTDQNRIVLILDILRPEFRGRALYVNAGLRATLYYSRLYEIFFPVIELFPRILTRLLHPLFHRVAYVWHLLRLRKIDILSFGKKERQ